LPTICEAPFHESVELFWLPSCLVTLYTSQWIDLYGIDVVERTRSIKGKSFWFREPQRQVGGTFFNDSRRGARVARRWPVSQ
jgi:hypothetical protein